MPYLKFEDMEGFRKTPITYAGAIDVSIYVNRDFAPAEDRLRSIIAIENEAPNVFATARANLEDSLAKPYIDIAITIAKGSAERLRLHVPPASMDTPARLKRKPPRLIIIFTPVDPSWTAQQREDWLRQFDYYTTDIVSIHEAYPVTTRNSFISTTRRQRRLKKFLAVMHSLKAELTTAKK